MALIYPDILGRRQDGRVPPEMRYFPLCNTENGKSASAGYRDAVNTNAVLVI